MAVSTSIKHDRLKKPPRMDVLIESIPVAMREEPRWVGWRWRWNKSKWTKVPVNLHNDRLAKSNDESTWCDFERASEAAKTELVDGIGFMLGDGFCGIDFDNCRDRETGEIAPDVLAYVKWLATYSEVSPSGEGVKLFLRGTLPKGKSQNGNVEMYDKVRFFVVTGHGLDEGGSELADDQAILDDVYGELIDSPRLADQFLRESGKQDRELAIAALEALSSKRADEYGSWLLTGMALHAVDSELLAKWDEWSKQSDKYQDDCCSEKWDSFHRSGDDSAVGLGSLIYWAMHDTPGWSPPGHFRLTDLGNAERFAAQHGNRVRHIPKWDRWLVWDGTRWCDDTTMEVWRLSQETVRSIAPGKWQVQSESHARISSMIKLAGMQRDVAINYDTLDVNPWLLNCTNGTLDLQSGKLRPHDPADLLTKSTGVEYPESDVPTPAFDKFLNSTFQRSTELIEFLQRLIGYAAIGVIQENVLPILWGSGSNGKSTFVDAIRDTLGDYCVQAPQNFLMVRRGDSHPTELTDLFGARFVSIAETGDGQRLDEGLVKMLTGGERIRARRMREDFWEFLPTHTPFLATNHRPVVRGGDHGIWRRLLLIPFSATFVDESERAKHKDAPLKDRSMSGKLKKEAPGILRWIVEGCLAWQKEGLNPPETVQLATNQYRDESDTFQQWFEDRCEPNSGSVCRAAEAQQSYLEWCTIFSETKLSKKAFADRLVESGFKKDRDGRGYYYRGFSIRDDTFRDENESDANDSDANVAA